MGGWRSAFLGALPHLVPCVHPRAAPTSLGLVPMSLGAVGCPCPPFWDGGVPQGLFPFSGPHLPSRPAGGGCTFLPGPGEDPLWQRPRYLQRLPGDHEGVQEPEVKPRSCPPGLLRGAPQPLRGSLCFRRGLSAFTPSFHLHRHTVPQ